MPKGMQASILWPLAAATLLALLVVGTARAANSLSFPDRTGDRGDAYGGLDISGLQVSSDDGGLLTFRVTTVGHKRKLGTYDGFVDVLLDLDQNPDTGSLFYGAEVGLDLSSDGLGFQRLTGFKSKSAPLPPSLSGSFRDGVVTFTVKASDLGVAPGVGFTSSPAQSPTRHRITARSTTNSHLATPHLTWLPTHAHPWSTPSHRRATTVTVLS
jgi:hypothetical protein